MRGAVKGLSKRCKHLDWTRCTCNWYGKFGGVHYTNLNIWSKTQLDTKQQAELAFSNFKSAILAGTFIPHGKRIDGKVLTFAKLLDLYRAMVVRAVKVWVTPKHGPDRNTLVERWKLIMKDGKPDGHHSTGTLPMCDVLEREFGDDKVEALSKMSRLMWVDRFDQMLNKRNGGRGVTERTRNKYFQRGRAIFSWAVSAELVTKNPFTKNEVFKLNRAAESENREVRIPEAAEQKMIDFCLTNARMHKFAGRHPTSGREMLRRLYAAIDCGLREGELVRVQNEHIAFDLKVMLENGTVLDAIKITLPPAVSKGGKTTGKREVVWAMTPRIRATLEERRGLGPKAYVFGTDSGGFVANFEKSWHRVYRAAGLTPGREDGGYLWHDLRHEYISYLIQQGASPDDVRRLARHKDQRTTDNYITESDNRLANSAALMGNRRTHAIASVPKIGTE
jgi:integrase